MSFLKDSVKINNILISDPTPFDELIKDIRGCNRAALVCCKKKKCCKKFKKGEHKRCGKCPKRI